MHPVIKKLQFKDQQKVLVLNAPPDQKDLVDAFPVPVNTTPAGKSPFVLVYLYQVSDFKKWLAMALDALEKDGLLWVCYPKKSSSKYKSDINRDCDWAPLTTRGFEGVRIVAVDEDWSALRFRDVDHIPHMARKSAMSDKGRKRISGK